MPVETSKVAATLPFQLSRSWKGSSGRHGKDGFFQPLSPSLSKHYERHPGLVVCLPFSLMLLATFGIARHVLHAMTACRSHSIHLLLITVPTDRPCSKGSYTLTLCENT